MATVLDVEHVGAGARVQEDEAAAGRRVRLGIAQPANQRGEAAVEGRELVVLPPQHGRGKLFERPVAERIAHATETSGRRQARASGWALECPVRRRAGCSWASANA